MTKKNSSKIKNKKDNFAISKIHNILKARKIDYVLKEVHLVEKFSDDRTKYKLIYEVIGELKGREETVIIIDGGEQENTNTLGGEDGNNGNGGEIKPNLSNDPEWKIYMNQVRDELRHKFSQELSNAKIELLQVSNENNNRTNKKIDETNKRIDGIEDTLKQILSILKDKK
ncbi:hypothetical protein CJJ23_03625 [Mycoplasmopsis agassizii]|uniref:Uncharacterized protein n=1 Tax=Mycoplasmopsis agassizii TaxID=33922 RepID=A0A269TIA8_9BACT|nr:hypothetical protein [Mycoplasmopsis agassizii]PAK21127.1 hypothetical protein CJJ23_03625 [Mycoplasmopsis agassizii]